MADPRLRLDGHKLMLHPQLVADYLAGRRVSPLYAEIGVTSRCNLQCRYCALDWLRQETRELPFPRALNLIAELAGYGVKSICFAGEGEPALYEGLPELITACSEHGIAAALVTNGTVLPPPLLDAVCRYLTWIKISVDAIRPETYARIHRVPGATVQTVLDNLARLAAARRCSGSALTIGTQAVLLPDNRVELAELAAAMRAAGADYLAIKPYLHNPRSGNLEYRDFTCRELPEAEAELAGVANADFAVYFRRESFRRVHDRQRSYHSCAGINFAAFIYSNGHLYSCPAHVGVDEYDCGTISDQSFAVVWEGKQRAAVLRRLTGFLSGCAHGCRLDAINEWLWEVRHPGPHADFV